MNLNFLPIARMAFAALALCVIPAVHAGPVAFTATITGESDIVEVIDPAVPVVRVQTLATAIGVFDITGYRSTDVVNLATGAGTGTNVFENADGDELFGNFTVQLIPTDDVSVLNLIGLVNFVGGTGLFEGATGTAQFNGFGQFTSATHALLRLSFVGELNLVPLPGTLALLLSGLLLASGFSGTRMVYYSRRSGATPA